MGIVNTVAKLKAYFETWHAESTNSHLDLIYPVGSIYMSVNDTNPKVLFGGQWEKIEGRFLLGSGRAPEDSTKTYNTKSIDGSKDAIVVSHTHTQDGHTHTQNSHAHNAPSGYYYVTVKQSDGAAPDLWSPDAYYNLNSLVSQTGNSLRQLIVAGKTHGFYVTEPRSTEASTGANQVTIATNQYSGSSGTNKNTVPLFLY